MSRISNKEHQNICPFGEALIALRKAKGVSAGRLSMKGVTFPSHLHKIERGLAFPSITVAIRLVSVLENDVSAFFKEFAISENLLSSNLTSGFETNTLDSPINLANSKNLAEVKSLFGILFREFRVIHKITQQKVSEFTEYSIRNIQKVEAGTQDPNVMTALAMVCAVANHANIDIAVFFNAYQEIIKKSAA